MNTKIITLLTSSFLFFIVITAFVSSYCEPKITVYHDTVNQFALQDEHGHEEEAALQDEHGHEEEAVVKLTNDEMKEFDIKVDTTGPGILQNYLNLTGEVIINPETMAHIVPIIPGIVSDVKKSLGDVVKKGDMLAILESRELATFKSAYLASFERYKLAKTVYNREEALWNKAISAEQYYLAAQQALAEAKIVMDSAEQQLHALGFSQSYVKQLPTEPDMAFTHFEIYAPFDGTIIEKHITLGEVLKDDSIAFVISDLTQVWINLTVYQKDLPSVHTGQSVMISEKVAQHQSIGTISYISPIIDEHTRTATARVVINNQDGTWRPGLFINGKVTVQNIPVPLLIPKSAIQLMEDRSVVFIKEEDGFVPQPIQTGRLDEFNAEVIAGLTPDQQYISKGGFVLKAELGKEALGEGGHSH